MMDEPFQPNPGDPEEEYMHQLLEALQDARQHDDKENEAKILVELGFCYADSAEYDKAAESLESGIAYYRKEKLPALAIPPQFMLAKIYLILKLHERAFSLYNEIIEEAEKLEDKNALGIAYAAKGKILVQEQAHQSGVELMFRGFQILDDFDLHGRDEVLRWVEDYRETTTPASFKRAIEQSSVSNKIKSILNAINS